MRVTATPDRKRDESERHSGRITPFAGDDDRTGETGNGAPSVALVAECEIAEGIFPIAEVRSGERVLLLVRMFTEPLGMIDVVARTGGLDPRHVADAIVRELGPQLQERFTECGLAWENSLPLDGLYPQKTPLFLSSRERVMHEGPWLTVAICTRDRPEGLAVTLDTLGTQEYGRFRVVVVDNAPVDDRARQVVNMAVAQHGLDIEHVIEPRPGLSWARNRAIEASRTEVIAFIDDDERCDRWWTAEVARGFVEVPTASAVTGSIVPGELATESQAYFEEFCGIRTGRGFVRAVFSPATAHRQSPLYPRPPFGSGGNMAYRRDVLNSIGRFDCALGAGTVTHGGEDTAALSTVLLDGGTIVYQPTAIVRHYYRRDYLGLRRQLRGYGRGLTSFYTSVLVRRPSSVIEILRLGGQTIREHLSHRDPQPRDLGENFPNDLLRANLIGRMQGPFTYVVARLQAQRLRQAAPGR
jgi:glycosyltransferase involved in cell wall biosynthesis